MTQQHPIIPPLELLKHWENQHFDEDENYDVMLIQAYQAGADQELKACCEWLQDPDLNVDTYKLRAARRPKSPSIKQQALALLQPGEPRLFNSEMQDTIRRALEALSDD